MKYHAVIELREGDVIDLRLYPEDREAVARAHALAIAKENTECSEEEILEHFETHASHSEGDWSVQLADAHVHES